MAIDPGYLTACVAALAVVITAGQWHTARSKLVLDLFEKRLDIYNELIAALAPVWAHGTSTQDDLFAFVKHESAEFLFGSDVVEYLKTIRQALANLELARTMQKAEQNDDAHRKAVDLEFREFEKVAKFREDFGRLVVPYITMDQMLPAYVFKHWLRPPFRQVL